MSDYYELLQVPRDADLAAIKASYRRLAREYHPDSNKSHIAAEHMKLLNAAYNTLSDPAKRQAYDELLKAEELYGAQAEPFAAQAYRRPASSAMRTWMLWIGMTALLIVAALTGTLLALRNQIPTILANMIATPTHVAVAAPSMRTPLPTFTSTPTSVPTQTPTARPSPTATTPNTATPTATPIPPTPQPVQPYPLPPNGVNSTRIVVAEPGSANGTMDIFVRNADGTNRINLTRTENQNEQSPSWSPQGQYVVFSEFNSGNLFVTSVEGNQLIRLTSDPAMRDSNPVWSPTGSLIAFTSISRADLVAGLLERAKVFVVDFNTHERRLIADQPGRDLTWSPDGRWLAYQVSSASGSTLYVTVVDRVVQPYWSSGARIRRIAWTPDSQKVVYETLVRDQSEIWVMTLQPFSIQRLTGSLTVVSPRGRFPGPPFEGEYLPPITSVVR